MSISSDMFKNIMEITGNPSEYRGINAESLSAFEDVNPTWMEQQYPYWNQKTDDPLYIEFLLSKSAAQSDWEAFIQIVDASPVEGTIDVALDLARLWNKTQIEKYLWVDMVMFLDQEVIGMIV